MVTKITTLICWTCEKTFERPTYVVRSAQKRYGDPKTFCSQKCLGKHVSSNWGFGSPGHPGGRPYNVAKTHCPKGHAYDQGNTYIELVTNVKKCKACRRVQSREYYHRNKGRAA